MKLKMRIIIFIMFVMVSFQSFNALAQIPTERVENKTNVLLGKLLNDSAMGDNRNISYNVERVSLLAQDEAQEISQSTIENEKKILNPWKDTIPFELTLDKIRTFIIAGRAVDKSNRSWDAMIAAAKTQEKAIGLHEQAAEEAWQVVQEIPRITLNEYKILFELSVIDNDFSTLLAALKQHIYPDENLITTYSN